MGDRSKNKGDHQVKAEWMGSEHEQMLDEAGHRTDAVFLPLCVTFKRQGRRGSVRRPLSRDFKSLEESVVNYRKNSHCCNAFGKKMGMINGLCDISDVNECWIACEP